MPVVKINQLLDETSICIQKGELILKHWISLKALSLKKCIKLCNQISICVLFSYDTDNNNCILTWNDDYVVKVGNHIVGTGKCILMDYPSLVSEYMLPVILHPNVKDMYKSLSIDSAYECYIACESNNNCLFVIFDGTVCIEVPESHTFKDWHIINIGSGSTSLIMATYMPLRPSTCVRGEIIVYPLKSSKFQLLPMIMKTVEECSNNAKQIVASGYNYWVPMRLCVIIKHFIFKKKSFDSIAQYNPFHSAITEIFDCEDSIEPSCFQKKKIDCDGYEFENIFDEYFCAKICSELEACRYMSYDFVNLICKICWNSKSMTNSNNNFSVATKECIKESYKSLINKNELTSYCASPAFVYETGRHLAIYQNLSPLQCQNQCRENLDCRFVKFAGYHCTLIDSTTNLIMMYNINNLKHLLINRECEDYKFDYRVYRAIPSFMLSEYTYKSTIDECFDYMSNHSENSNSFVYYWPSIHLCGVGEVNALNKNNTEEALFTGVVTKYSHYSLLFLYIILGKYLIFDCFVTAYTISFIANIFTIIFSVSFYILLKKLRYLSVYKSYVTTINRQYNRRNKLVHALSTAKWGTRWSQHVRRSSSFISRI